MRVITLEYHDVVDGDDFDRSGFPGAAANTYKLARRDFAAHLDVLRAREHAGIDVTRAGAVPAPVLITFDDGGVSALDTCAPLLESRGYVGHFFITTGRLDTAAFCSSENLRELVRRGHVVGSHSHSHPTRMASLSDAELMVEWQRSVELLADVLGSPPPVASVPGGYYSARVGRAAARAGIRWLFTSEPVTSVHREGDCLILGRYTLRRNTAVREVASLVAPRGFARSRQWVTWTAKKVVKAALGETYLRARASILGDDPRARPSGQA